MKRNKLLVPLIGTLLILYPFIVYFGISWFSIKWLGLVILLIFSIRLYMVNAIPSKTFSRFGLGVMVIIAIVLVLISLISSNPLFLKLYPVLMNLGFFILFASSLLTEKNMILRFAMLAKKSALPPEAVNYTKKVTIIWCCFFIINGMIALYTSLFSSIQTWTLYNGFIAYLLMALLMIIEILVRHTLHHKSNHDA
ncbi:COG4648 family protein [Facilibium subflavum]|uniref:COG4648 family protein n=1 Tax=Facilibium subflavum TaxID=2219058 RepID=UPI000E64ECFF|nr:septation protein IspZ [Facilibium subflavum]